MGGGKADVLFLVPRVALRCVCVWRRSHLLFCDAADRNTMNNNTSPLVGLATQDVDAFKNLLQFLGDPQSFQVLGKTCKTLHNVFAPRAQVTWNITMTQLVQEARVNGKNRYGDDTEQVGALYMDPRLPTLFEKVMVRNTLAKMMMSQNKDTDIILTEYKDGAFETLWLQPLADMIMAGHANTFGPLPEAVVFRNDFVRSFAALVEGNMIEIIRRANDMMISGTQEDTYPVLETSNVFDYLKQHLEACGVGIDMTPNRGPEYYQAMPICNVFGGKALPFPRLASIDSKSLELNPLWQQQFPINYGIIRRLAYQAGVVKLTHSAFVYLWRLAVCMSSSLFYLLEKERENNGGAYQDMAASRGLTRLAPNTGTTWIPIPHHLNEAARSLGLLISTVLDSGEEEAVVPENNAQAMEAIFEMEEEDAFDDFKLHWRHLSSRQKKEILNEPKYDFYDDMDLDMGDYEDDLHPHITMDDSDDDSMYSIELERDDDMEL